VAIHSSPLEKIAISLFIILPPFARAGTDTPKRVQQLVRDIRASSFPELSDVDVRVRSFTSDSDYFRARFSIVRFFFAKKMRYFIEVNSTSAILTAPDAGVRAIVAHEFAHVTDYARGNRLHLFGLLRLTNKKFRERFEKRADTEAVKRGYATGLKEYRLWLYEHVPARALAQKKKDYLSPDEIDALARKH
jgi:hypothetical protein